MTVLVICNWGKNRSGYLASYLGQKGYTVKFAGINPETDNPVTQDLVDWSTVIIFIQPQIKTEFLTRFRADKQRLITLDVEDRIEVLAPNEKGIAMDRWLKIQRELVYPELEKQIDPYLSLD